uniref:Uncharacterized protein n=1 Tax=Arundo donax TaxID=35708 RepID=A0A0A9H2S5_ARUDO
MKTTMVKLHNIRTTSKARGYLFVPEFTRKFFFNSEGSSLPCKLI